MKTTLFAVLVVGLLLGADDPAKDSAKTDKEKVQGEWVAELWDVNGEKQTGDQAKEIKISVDGDNWTLQIAGNTLKGTHKLDASKKPKTIDGEITEGGSGAFMGIYELKGDTWKECWTHGNERPKEFKVNADAGHNLIIWKRVKK
jgi:uncharacterized protein (TIGR03067 family)